MGIHLLALAVTVLPVPRILVVHDAPVVSALLARVLRDAGYTVAVLQGVPSAPIAAQTGDVDLIITNSCGPEGPDDHVLQLRDIFPELPIFNVDSVRPFNLDVVVESVALAVGEHYDPRG